MEQHKVVQGGVAVRKASTSIIFLSPHTRTHILAFTHARTHARTYTRAHARTHLHTRARNHADVVFLSHHLSSHSLSLSVGWRDPLQSLESPKRRSLFTLSNTQRTAALRGCWLLLSPSLPLSPPLSAPLPLSLFPLSFSLSISFLTHSPSLFSPSPLLISVPLSPPSLAAMAISRRVLCKRAPIPSSRSLHRLLLWPHTRACGALAIPACSLLRCVCV